VSCSLLRCMSPEVARNGPTAMADLSPLLGDERKSDFADLRAAVHPKRSFTGSLVTDHFHLVARCKVIG
jgi:hypothetical protein